jgi:hypothetical protein
MVLEGKRNLDIDRLKNLSKKEIPDLAKELSSKNVDFLVATLTEKDDTVRYNAFLLLQANSRLFPLVYSHWEEIEKKLENPNSYQRSLGLMLIAENVKWDNDGKFSKTIDNYLICCADEKFITARQAIQGLANVVKATSKYDNKIIQALTVLSIDKYKENQQNLLKKDAANIMRMIEKR